MTMLLVSGLYGDAEDRPRHHTDDGLASPFALEVSLDGVAV